MLTLRVSQKGDGMLLKEKIWKKTEKLFSKRNQVLIFFLTFILAAVAVYDAKEGLFPQPVSITLYVFAAIGFLLSCTLWIKAILFFVNMIFLPFTKKNRYVNRLIRDTRLRTVMLTLPGMGLNLIYAVFNGAIGMTRHSAWYGSLSAYYIFLCVMRFLAVFYAKDIYINKKKNVNLKEGEWKIYRNCGVFLTLISIVMGGAVVMLVFGEGGKSYSGLLIYAVATYTFIKMGIAIKNMIQVRKEKSYLMMTLRNISYSDALVSILSLQTALFAAFGKGQEEFSHRMNALTGTAVCLMILSLGIYTLHDAKKK